METQINPSFHSFVWGSFEISADNNQLISTELWLYLQTKFRYLKILPLRRKPKDWITYRKDGFRFYKQIPISSNPKTCPPKIITKVLL